MPLIFNLLFLNGIFWKEKEVEEGKGRDCQKKRQTRVLSARLQCTRKGVRSGKEDPKGYWGRLISSTSSSRRPFGTWTWTISPTFFPMRALATGEVTLILLAETSASSAPTI